jgi:carnosine N-methyltransferase
VLYLTHFFIFYFFEILVLYVSTFAMRRVARAHENFSCLPLHHQQLLNDFLPNLDRLKAAIDTNHQFIDRLMKSAQGMFVNSSVADALPRPVDDSDRSGPTGCVPSSFDMEKVKTTIKQFFRDWSAEGAAERHQCYEPILSELKNLLPLATADESAWLWAWKAGISNCKAWISMSGQ